VKLAIIGGTGPEGKGLAYRFAVAGGQEVLIGSRNRARAEAAAREVVERSGHEKVAGLENDEAAQQSELAILTVPASAQADTLPALRQALRSKTVVSTAVPLSFRGGRPAVVAVAEGSAAEQAQALLPRSTVVGAFQNLGAAKLWEGDTPMGQDVVVCADDEHAKQQVMALAERLRGVRAVDGGPLSCARYVEGITALLLNINRRYKTLAGVRIVGM
jgi:hypothetical protein